MSAEDDCRQVGGDETEEEVGQGVIVVGAEGIGSGDRMEAIIVEFADEVWAAGV